ncbi:hypothetical protein ABJ384_05950 [Acinetobacter sp. A1-4-2]|uniref:Uncharacterized protein n=1 Tax=Acinetobacter sp. A1-4-2 TaxID=3156489 RepID=A0AAU7T0K4_9GAMM
MVQDNETNFNKLLSLGPLEVATIAFFISVGISLIYKNGFYSKLGIDWYLNNLSPQYIFMSSLGLVLPIFLSIFLGVFLSIKYKEFMNSIGGQALYLIFVFGGLIAIKLGLHIPFIAIILIFILFITMLMIESIQALSNIFTLPDVNVIHNKITVLMKSFMLISLVFSIFSICYSPYLYGQAEATEIISKKTRLNLIELHSDKHNWLLLEMNGDKALLINSIDLQSFKIVEYKDIKEIKVK